MGMSGVIMKDPEILGGEPVFRGTRVPFKILIDYLEGGDTLDQFLEQYPSVSQTPSLNDLYSLRSRSPLPDALTLMRRTSFDRVEPIKFK
jgi:hypothetical protein